jgi:hypothetical protein
MRESNTSTFIYVPAYFFECQPLIQYSIIVEAINRESPLYDLSGLLFFFFFFFLIKDET